MFIFFILSLPFQLTKNSLSGSDILSFYKYPAMEHTVTTYYGYMLKLINIPYSPRWKGAIPNIFKPVVFIQHGMTGSSDTFLLTGPSDGLPYMLADAGFDVWLGNSRGNTYSRKNKRLSPRRIRFWRFSWHEMGKEDIPASIDYVLNKTRQPALHYVGYSQGCTVFLVMLSMRPEYVTKIKTTNLMQPPGLCRNLFLMVNPDSSNQMNRNVIGLLLKTHPAGISSRQLRHYMQLKQSKRFRMFDYGYKTNMLVYRNASPIDYPLKYIQPQSPIHIYFSTKDDQATKKDILFLARRLYNRRLHQVPKAWSHKDFMFGCTVGRDLSMPILIAGSTKEV
ncbi:lipase 1 [Drosophila obscura]|uniref:lipase 1 n=1 Tax=Drosophila obscura TaxID=7282 RepID=UPI001BB21FA6|nr:lipase 1 [Drosophila obscura]